MSKIGQQPISIPSGVQFDINSSDITVKGPKGTLTFVLPTELNIKKDGENVLVDKNNESKRHRSMHGLFRNLLSNAIKGVAEHWKKRLEVVGTGFNVKMQGQAIALKVGFSHLVVFKPVDGIELATEGNNIIIVSGADKQLVGQVAHQIRTIREPDVYKGKGIRYEGEYIKTKAGKKAKAA